MIWLTADVDSLWQRLEVDPTTAARRPALAGGGRDEVVQVLRTRESLYRDCAGMMIETADRSPQAVVDEILRLMKLEG